MTKRTVLFLLSCVVLAGSAAAANSSQPDLASADWSVKAPHSFRDNPPSSQAVWFFINRLGDPSLDVSELTAGDGELCSFRFADLRRSGELSLVAVYDRGGTADCNQLTIFDRDPAGIEPYDYSGALVSTDVNVVKDINGDGHFELVVFARLTPLGEGLDWTDEWPSVYAWTGSGYTNVSSHYPTYYRTWLASLKKEIASLETKRERVARATPAPSAANGIVIVNPFRSGSAPSPPPAVYPMQPEQPEPAPSVSAEVEAASRLEIDYKQAQAAKIERFLGSKDAGMLDAIRWANSDDPRERTLATSVFVYMGTPEALRYERTLSHDADPKVAKLAQRDLKSWWGKAEPYYAPTFDRKLPDDSGNY